MNARIAIVDDHEIVREGIRTLLAKTRPEWLVCGEAANGAHAIALIRDLSPDVVVLDISMPGASGFEVASRVVAAGVNCRILMFTTHDFDRLDSEVRQVGARGYVLKSQAARDLVAAIDVLLSGGTFFGKPCEPEREPDNESNPGILFCQGLAIAPI